MSAPAETRLVDLEIRYTHLQHQFDELNGVVVAQQRAIDDLTKRLVALTARVHDLGESPRNDPPPHY